MADTGFIYALTDPRIDDSFLAVRYIGLTKHSLHRRLIVHLSDARKGNKTHRSKWIRLLLADGIEPGIITLETAPCDQLASREIVLIADYRGRGAQLVNGTSGGDGVRDLSEESLGRMRFAAQHRSAETREKIRQWRLGKKHSDETRQKIGDAWKGYSEETQAKIREATRAANLGNTWSLGREVSIESRQKMSQAQSGHHRNVGYKHTAEARARMSASGGHAKAWLGKKRSDETKAKISQSLMGRPGRPLSAESIRKISEAQRGERRPNAKLTWEIVRSIRARIADGSAKQKQIASEYGVRQSLISLIVHNKRWQEIAPSDSNPDALL